MIYTITLNPALDRTLRVDKLVKDDANRVQEERRYAGGKGIDVSRVIKELGSESIALGFLGGYTGLEIEGRLLNEGVICDFVKISEETRTNIIICDSRSDKQTTLNAKGPEISPLELGMFYNKIKKLRPKPTFSVLSGSLPKNVNDNFYLQLVNLFKSHDAFVVLDSDGMPFKLGLQGEPNMIKPNIHELERIMGETISSDDEIINAGMYLINKYNIEIVLVSNGPKGLYLITENEKYRALVPDVPVESAIGAGDSTVAGFIYGMEKGYSIKECLRSAAAAGTACVLTPGTQLVERADYEKYLPEIIIEKMD